MAEGNPKFGIGIMEKKYTNSGIIRAINEHIHSARDRRIMILHYVDGLSADAISRIDEKRKDIPSGYRIELEPRSISRIIQNRLAEIENFL